MRRLWRALRRSLAHAGTHSAAIVYDLTNQTQLYSLRDGMPLPPASVEKLYTTVALLKKLGADARLHTSVYGAGHLGAGGVWHGDLFLRGDGDPTLGDGTFIRVWDLGSGTNLADLAAAVRGAGIRSVTGSLIADASVFDGSPGGPATNYGPDIPDFGGQLSGLTFDHGAAGAGLGPAAFAARQLATMLRAAHVQVNASPATGKTPHDAHKLATVASPRLATLLRLMDVPSDDLFAELLTKQLGARYEHRGTIGAGAKVISDVIGGYGLHPTILDGSGLDRDDRSSAHEVESLLRLVWNTDEGRVLAASLPRIGMQGTVRRIGTGTPAQGRCVGKTGTLNNVTNLAGYCHSAGHRMLAYALFIDGPSNLQAIALLSQMVAAIQRY